MSRMKTTLTLDGDEYEVEYSADIAKAEPQTMEYPGCPASIDNAGITKVTKNVWDEDAKKYTLVNLPYELFKNVWDELNVKLDEKLDQSGTDLLQDLAEQMEDRWGSY